MVLLVDHGIGVSVSVHLVSAQSVLVFILSHHPLIIFVLFVFLNFYLGNSHLLLSGVNLTLIVSDSRQVLALSVELLRTLVS